MSTEQNKEIVRRTVEEVYNQRNIDKFNEFYAPDYIHHDPAVPDVHTRDELVAYQKVMWGAFTEAWTAITNMTAEGDFVAKQWRWTATHTGDLYGIPPTGKKVDMTAITLYRVVGGKIVEDWWNTDALGFWQQLGFTMTSAEAQAA